MTMRKHPPINISDALWSTQRALFGEVTPDLRAVTVDVHDGIRLRFVYDRPIDEDLRTITYMVAGEVNADDPDDDVDARAETQMDGPITLTALETPAYHRRESDPLKMTAASAHPGGHPDFLENRDSWTTHQTRRALGRLAVQAALLGEVTPDLRVVVIDPTDGVGVRMVYDHPIDAEIDSTVTRVDIATKSALHLDTAVATRAECVPEGRAPTSDAEVYAYERNEGQW
jgi:hypothetical protein